MGLDRKTVRLYIEQDAAWPSGAGGLRPFPHGVHREAGPFKALGGVPEHLVYGHVRPVFSREGLEAGHIIVNRNVARFARHYGYPPHACKPYWAKTEGKVERPFRYIREDFFLSRSFDNLDDLNRPLQG